jgi:hypothetical protein
MSNHHDDEPLFPLEMSEHRYPLGDSQQTLPDDDSSIIDNDDDNRFVDNDTGVDPSQSRYKNEELNLDFYSKIILVKLKQYKLLK